jgi:hypothetical protein
MQTKVRFQWFMILALILIAGGLVVAQDVTYNFDQTADFSKYKTYKWADVVGAMHPDQLTDKNIRSAVDAELAKKGLTKTDAEKADLMIGYQLAVNQEKQIDTWGAPGWRWGGMQSATTSTINVGTLVLDIYDPSMKQLVWRGTATKTIQPSKDPQKNLERLQKAMAKLLKNYPPPPAKK